MCSLTIAFFLFFNCVYVFSHVVRSSVHEPFPLFHDINEWGFTNIILEHFSTSLSLSLLVLEGIFQAIPNPDESKPVQLAKSAMRDPGILENERLRRCDSRL